MNDRTILEEKHEQNSEARNSRFSFHEIFITAIIVLLVVAIVAPLVVKYVHKAEEDALSSNAKAMWILVNTALLLDEYTEKDLEDFSEKYKNYRKLSDLNDGTMVLEQSTMSRMDRFNPKDFYIKIEFEASVIAKVSVSKDKDGKDSAAYSE